MSGYQNACELRKQAELTTNPQAYLDAAQAFDEIGMPAAAERMRERAQHYERQAVIDATPG